MRFQFDKASDQRRSVLTHRNAHAIRHVDAVPPVDVLHANDDAVAALALFANFDKARNRYRGHGRSQDRMRDAHGLQGRGGKAGGHGGDTQPKRKADGAAPRRKGYRDPGNGSGRRRPPRRFAVGGKIKDDAETEGDREPRQQPARRHFNQSPLHNDLTQPVCPLRQSRRP